MAATTTATSLFFASNSLSDVTAPSPACSAPWLSWAGSDTAVLRQLAVFLPFSDADLPLPVPAVRTGKYRSSFLSLARTCRRAYEVLTSDAACWSTQRLRIELSEPLLEDDDFVLLGADECQSRLALRVDRFTARRQEIVRRLIGAEAYWNYVASHMAELQEMTVPYMRVFIMDESGVAHVKNTAEVYVRLTRSLFVFLLTTLLQPPRAHVQDVSLSFGCYSFVLLPSCVSLAPTAIVIPAPGESQVGCFHRLLRRLPAVKELTLHQHRPASKYMRSLLVWEWEQVRKAMPYLRTFRMLNTQLRWNSVLKPLLTGELGELCELHIDSDSDNTTWDRITDNWSIPFHFPPHPHKPTTAANCGEDDAGIITVQLRLQLALCRHVAKAVRDVFDRTKHWPGADEWWQATLEECDHIERELLAKQQAQLRAEEQQPRTKRARLS